eukprot:IDg19841t1
MPQLNTTREESRNSTRPEISIRQGTKGQVTGTSEGKTHPKPRRLDRAPNNTSISADSWRREETKRHNSPRGTTRLPHQLSPVQHLHGHL